MLADSSTYNQSTIQTVTTPKGGSAIRLFQAIFSFVVLLYCYFYAPYGVNQSDGGFITGLAWEVLQGKSLYSDLIYVRPPLPVWLQAFEMALIPEFSESLIERYFFFLKVALYVWLGSSLLTVGANRYILATLAFIVSVHCYPPAAWHTVDGILAAVLGLWMLNRNFVWTSFLGGFFFVAATLCKQSFYPIWGIFFLYLLFFEKPKGLKTSAFLGAICSISLFYTYLHAAGLWSNYHAMIGGVSSVSKAIQHGIWDYFDINPILLVVTLVFGLPVILFFKNENTASARFHFLARTTWSLWLFFLAASYVYSISQRNEFTVPFAQARMLFLVAFVYYSVDLIRAKGERRQALMPLFLLGLSWMGSLSWTYNLPILFAVPLVYTQMEIGRRLFVLGKEYFLKVYRLAGTLMSIFLLLLCFRFAYEYIYAGGRRSEMTENLGSVFKRQTGVYTDASTIAMYQEFRELVVVYGKKFTVLPNLTNAHFLTNTTASLPLNWVEKREIGGFEQKVLNDFRRNKPVLFLMKSEKKDVEIEAEMALVRQLLSQSELVADSTFFEIYQIKK